MRSMTTANWTRINFTLSELLHIIERVELQNDIAYYKLSNSVEFPRASARVNSNNIYNECPTYDLPSNDELLGAIKNALTDAMQCASQFGMNCEDSDILKCPLRNLFGYRNQPDLILVMMTI